MARRGVGFNIVGVRASALDRIHRHPHHLGLLFAQRLSVLFVPKLAEDVNIGNTDAGVDSRLLGFGQRLAASFDIFRYRPRKPADDGAFDLACDPFDGLEIFR